MVKNNYFPKISIVLPVYNGEKFLRDLLTSIQSQTYVNYELVIVNDGSTDATSSLCDEFASRDDRIKVYNRKNSGVSNSRNYGVRQSVGDYIAFVDADDILKIDALQLMVDFAQRYDAQVVRMSYELLKKDKYVKVKPAKLSGYLNTKSEIRKFTSSITNGSTPAYVWLLLVERSIATHLKFRAELTMMEDAVYYVELLSKVKRIYLSNIVTYSYRQAQDSASRSSRRIGIIIDDIIIANSFLLKLVDQDKAPEVNASRANTISNYAVDEFTFFKRKRFNEVYEHLHKHNDYINLIDASDLSTLPWRFRATINAIYYGKYTHLVFVCSYRRALQMIRSLIHV